MILQTTAESIANEKLVCSGSVAVGTILSSSGAYYAISDKPQSASGECSCDYSTSQLDCKVAPEFPVSAPQGPAVCQPAGQTTCAIPNISLCQEGKLIGGLNSDGGFYVTGQSDKASGYSVFTKIYPLLEKTRLQSHWGAP
ncbi:hypothetical protein PCASD_09443 [Puccinia coronata f. sp. avenae]|uniref:Uncharacterized protein n=1 Tax=Puccinia coronata f. sp. avenae TaxID=200324 RepID=A0A2N5UKP6_9BASI|nr:hypothetical protein PCASD_09443 [Puccinia coronata f. sp. avenae]